jgi:hypothetical protein
MVLALLAEPLPAGFFQLDRPARLAALHALRLEATIKDAPQRTIVAAQSFALAPPHYDNHAAVLLARAFQVVEGCAEPTVFEFDAACRDFYIQDARCDAWFILET